MKARFLVLLTPVLAFFLVGCPWLHPQLQFRSADLRYGRGGVLDTAGDTPASDIGGAAPEATVNREVVEPDVIRQAGNLLYVLNQYRGLTIVDLDSNQVLRQAPTYGFPRDLYVVGDRAYVLVAYGTDYQVEGATVSFSVKSKLYVVDVSNPSEASILGSFPINGDLVDSRLVGDVVYAVAAEYQWYWVEPAVMKTVTSSSWVTSINVADPNNIVEADTITFGGSGTVVQATSSAIYVCAPSYETGNTLITYVDIGDSAGQMAVRGSVEVTGSVNDRFKLDAYNGVLRVVSTGWSDGRRVYVSTIDLSDPDNLAKLAELEIDKASGETLFATRFDGPRAYLVTFFVVDPLFVLDLSDPASPTLAGELIVPGWSTHIEPRGDRLIALGVDDTDGRRVSVSLFDVTEPSAPALLDRVSFGEHWAWSSAYSDVKAFTVLDDVILAPFSGWNEYGGYDRLQFISHTPNDLTLRGSVDVNGSVLRSFARNDSYYCVTNEAVNTIDASNLDEPTVTQDLVLAENVADFVELTPELGASILTRYDTGATTVRLTGLPLKAAGDLDVNIGSYANGFAYGNSLILVGTVYDAKGGYVVAVVDCSNPSGPVLTTTVEVDVWPYYGYGYWPSPLGVVDRAAGVAIDYMPWWFPGDNTESTFLVGNRLVLRCVANAYDSVLGSAPASQGLAVINLDAPSGYTTIGLGINGIVSINPSGENVILGNTEYAGTEMIVMPLAAHYVRMMDVAAVTAGPAANVPGSFLQYDAARNILALRDYQWRVDGTVESTVETVSWDGGDTVTPLDSESLPDNVWRVLAAGEKLYFDQYDSGIKLTALSVGPLGGISVGEPVLVTDQWAALFAAKGNSAYVTIGGGAIARYDFSGEPDLTDIVEVMATPWRLRFGSSQAFAPLGYSGLIALPL